MGKILYVIIGYLLVWRQKGVQNYFLLYSFSVSVWLKWGSVSGADAYEIYVMNPSRSEKNFSLVGEVTSITNDKLDTAFILQTAGRCDVCNSKWYDDFVRHWKDSVCCDIRGKEPNTNNGTCVSPDSFDSTKVGVKHSRITAFPGCSQVTAGEESHFCKEPESSSSESSSTEWSSSSAESSSSDGSSSSSAMLISSSSEEQESADCYTGVAEANAALYNVEGQKEMLGHIKGAYLEWNAKEIAHMNTKQKYGDYVIQASPQPTSRNREAIPCQGK